MVGILRVAFFEDAARPPPPLGASSVESPCVWTPGMRVLSALRLSAGYSGRDRGWGMQMHRALSDLQAQSSVMRREPCGDF
eukprot:8019506-Lingulodinium_polyedra.AAC.1